MEKLTPEMKAALTKKKLAEEIANRIKDACVKTPVIPTTPNIVLPEDFNGRDLKRYKKMFGSFRK